MTYREQLDHPKWQMRRLKILKRDKATCQECGCKEKQLHIHHKRYVRGRMAWEYEDWELTTLCKDCHALKHPKKDKEQAKPEPQKEKTEQELLEIVDYHTRKAREAQSKLGSLRLFNSMTHKEKISIFSGIRAKLG